MSEKSETFAGDVGSISMALFGLLYDKDNFRNGQLGYILFFSVYGIDAIIILVRLKTKKIFSNRIVLIYINIWQMKWVIPMFWFHLLCSNSAW
jgi:hypothetical protein